MKNRILPFVLALLFFSCGDDKKIVNVDSQRIDSATKEQIVNSNLKNIDTQFVATLPPVIEGDLIFQNALDEQSIAFGKATKSKYNNVGIIYIRPKDRTYMVLDTRDSIHGIPLSEWMVKGDAHHIALLRLKNSNIILNEKKTPQLRMTAKTLKSKKYDPYFSWSDDAFYSSEMIWKLYKIGAQIELSTLGKVSQLDLSGALVQQQMKNKYGANIPKDEPMATPDDLYNSQKMEIVYEK